MSIESVQAALKAACYNYDPYRTNLAAIEYIGGSESVSPFQLNEICIKPPLYDLRNRGAKPDYLLIYTNLSKELPYEQAQEYLDWWVNNGPFKEAFFKKDNVLDNGAALDCKYPIEFLTCAIQGYRYIGEIPRLVKNWGVFKQYIPDFYAAVLAHFLQYFEKPNVYNNRTIGNTNHQWCRSQIEYIIADRERNFSMKGMQPAKERLVIGNTRDIYEVKRDINEVKYLNDLIIPPVSNYSIKNTLGRETSSSGYPAERIGDVLKEIVEINFGENDVA